MCIRDRIHIVPASQRVKQRLHARARLVVFAEPLAQDVLYPRVKVLLVLALNELVERLPRLVLRLLCGCLRLIARRDRARLLILLYAIVHVGQRVRTPPAIVDLLPGVGSLRLDGLAACRCAQMCIRDSSTPGRTTSRFARRPTPNGTPCAAA